MIGKMFYLTTIITFVVSIFMLFILKPTRIFYEKNLSARQNELKANELTSILTTDGKLFSTGWSKSHELFRFNKDNIKPSSTVLPVLNSFRYKKWEAVLFIHKEFILLVGVFDLSYLGGFLMHYSDLTDKDSDIIAGDYINPITKPSLNDNCLTTCNLGHYEIEGQISYNHTKLPSFNNQKYSLNATIPNLHVKMDLDLHAENYDSITTLTSISEDSTLFYFNTKMNNILATGVIEVNGKQYNTKDLIITHDSGKGAWPVNSGWFWVSGNGRTKEGDLIGINIGHGFSNPDMNEHTEDCFFVNGKMLKLPSVMTNKITIDEAKKLYRYEFESVYDETIKNSCSFKANAIRNNYMEKNLLIGQVNFQLTYIVMNGYCTDDKSKRYEFENVYGLVENKMSVW
jgi:hypothetical protein